ncbi:MAG: hypothetical protein A2189_01975 [Paenibacillus sp. RIFOXYA1_FULL_44_5]|nr:MAG: hypothetical protein A2189_01975 [Paenibacillus sp. RIFOXYA1_FULL_44_5]
MIRKKNMIPLITVSAAAVLLMLSLFIKPLIGLADNGDFYRIMHSVGIKYINNGESHYERYFGFTHVLYSLAFPNGVHYWTTEVPIVYASIWLNRLLFSNNTFDIRFLSLVYSLFYLAALYLLIRQNRHLPARYYFVFAIIYVIIFTDIGYSSYFNSFFGEPVSYVFLLLTWFISFHIVSQKMPSHWLLPLFWLSGLMLFGAKTQNVPIAIALGLMSLLFIRLRKDKLWRSLAIAGALVPIILGALILLSTPQDLRVINTYQTVFYGVLKNSPSPEQDLQQLGVNPDLAVLAGTNYFTKKTAISPDSPQLIKPFYSRITYSKIAWFYIQHPYRFLLKLQATAQHAADIRPLYLGNYVKSEHLPYGSVAHFSSLWSSMKKSILPHRLVFYFIFFMVYFAGAGAVWRSSPDSRRKIEASVYVLWGAAAILTFVIPVLGDGEADLSKHLFLFNVFFDLMLLSIVKWIIEAFSQQKENHAAQD